MANEENQNLYITDLLISVFIKAENMGEENQKRFLIDNRTDGVE